MRAIAIAKHGELRERITSGALPDALPELEALGGPFDGALCSAVLQHLPRHALFDAVFSLRGLLVPHGRVLVSIPSGGRTLDAEGYDRDGRLYTAIPAGELRLLFERCGFATIGSWSDDDSLGRSGMVWHTLLFELESSGGTRPLDLVEGVLSQREKKVATYKLALFRALCEIALTQPRLATWLAGDRVAVPLDAIATRWVRYYWPLFASGRFMPQMNGERRATGHRLGFTRELETLMTHYGRARLPAYLVDEGNGALDPATARHRKSLLSKLVRVIRQGPATYAGGSLQTGRLFTHDERSLSLDGNLWRELVLTGHWIQDAIVLRWADLTAGLPDSDVTPGDVVSVLTQDSSADRFTTDARAIFAGHDDLRCVWSGKALTAERFVIDHVLPFSLWRNNALWNLLPADAAVNGRKSDRLPERRLLLARRDAVIGCWEVAREKRPTRFKREAEGLAGSEEPGLGVLFEAMVEAVEVTAMQRGAERWAG